MANVAELYREAVRLIEGSGGRLLRLMGSVALAARCGELLFLWEKLNREPAADIDLVTLALNERQVREIMPQLGYHEDGAFHYRRAAYRRLVYYGRSSMIEIFIDPLPFHHTIQIGCERFEVDETTVSLADLFMLKIQYAELARKQMIDLCLLLATHRISTSDDSCISVSRLVQLVEDDWGLWRTASTNLRKLDLFVRRELFEVDAELGRVVSLRIKEIFRALQEIERDSNWRVQNVLHRMLPCLPIGRPIDDPTEDRWGSFRR